MTKKRFGIRFRLIAVMIAITLVPLVVTGYFLAKVNEESIKIQTKDYQLALSSQVSEIINDMVDSTCRELHEIEMLLNDGKLSPDHTIRLAGYQIARSAKIDFVNIYDSTGAFLDTLLPGDRQPPGFAPPKLDDAFRHLMQSRSCCLDQVFLSHASPNNNILLLPICIPWRGQDQLQGYLWTAIDITPLSKRIDTLIRDRFTTMIHSAFLVNKDFQSVADSRWQKIPGDSERSVKEHPLFKKIFANSSLPQKGVGISLDYKDKAASWLVNLNTIPRLDWLLVIMQKKSDAYRILYNMQEKILLVGSIFLFIAALIGALLGGRLSQPILEVARGARELATPKFSHRIPVRSKDEIGEMAQAFNYLGQSLEEYDARIKREVAIRSDLSRYLTPELVEAIIERRASLELGGKRQQVTVLFADVVNFTPLSESLPPEKVVALLNELFTILTQIIFRNNGMVDKFIGDCVMALFGAPDPSPQAVANAVKTAREMVKWLEVGNKKWKKQYDVTLQLAISLDCGEVIVGNVGSEKRMEYTAIGDVVNTAARLEKIAQPNQILVTGALVDQLENKNKVNPFGRFELRGKNRETNVFEVMI